MYLSKIPFISWHMREMMMTQEGAEKKWDKDFHDKKIKRRTEDGMVKLAVAGHSYEVVEKGRMVEAASSEPMKEKSLKHAINVVMDRKDVTRAGRTPKKR